MPQLEHIEAIEKRLWTAADTGLPVEAYTEEDVNEKAEEVFRHVYRAYPILPSPFYTSSPAAG
jgi:type I restriction enzyme R subunit